MIRSADEGGHGRQAGGDAEHGQQQPAERHLGSTEPEDRVAELPQPARAHFQANDEQEHDDADLGDVKQRVGIGDQAEDMRADQQAGGQVAEHGPEPEPGEYRHRRDRRGQQHHGKLKVEPFGMGHGPWILPRSAAKAFGEFGARRNPARAGGRPKAAAQSSRNSVRIRSTVSSWRGLSQRTLRCAAA